MRFIQVKKTNLPILVYDVLVLMACMPIIILSPTSGAMLINVHLFKLNYKLLSVAILTPIKF